MLATEGQGTSTGDGLPGPWLASRDRTCCDARRDERAGHGTSSGGSLRLLRRGSFPLARQAELHNSLFLLALGGDASVEVAQELLGVEHDRLVAEAAERGFLGRGATRGNCDSSAAKRFPTSSSSAKRVPRNADTALAARSVTRLAASAPLGHVPSGPGSVPIRKT